MRHTGNRRWRRDCSPRLCDRAVVRSCSAHAGLASDCGLTWLFFCGLACGFCVRISAIVGVALDFERLVIGDAMCAVKLPGSVQATDRVFSEAGIQRIQSAEPFGGEPLEP